MGTFWDYQVMIFQRMLFLVCRGLLITAILAVVSLQGQLHAGEPRRPNVVVLLADDLGVQDIGCYDGPVQTPSLDRLAASGTKFKTFYSGCAVCSPSRATLLTGRHHIRAGVYSWISDSHQRSHLLERETTLAEILKNQGYRTAHVGKWHLGLPTGQYQKPTPDQHGFDHWFATWNNAEPSHRDPHNFIRNGNPVGKLSGYSCQLVVDEATSWLDSLGDRDEPFFLNVWFHEPHAPIAAPDAITEKYGQLKEPGAVYSGTIDNTDRAVERLLRKLEQVDDPKNTLIFYASDNGSYRDDRTGGLRGKKGVNWEGGIRVPGIFSWPGMIPAGVVCEEPAGVIDLVPTVCGLLGIRSTAGPPLDGVDLSELLLKPSSDWQRERPLFWHLQKSRPIVAMRDGNYVLVADPDYDLSTSNMFNETWIPKIKRGGYTNYQLFDLESDPRQTQNLSTTHPELLREMKEDLLRINASIMADGADWHLQE
jgi:arylsulfatase A